MDEPSFVDRPGAVRPGEELDERQLREYLQGALGMAPGTLRVEQFHGGYSNLTYLLRIGNLPGHPEFERELVLRRPPFGANIKGGHDMGREFRILTALANTYGKVPNPLLYCTDESILGAPFYVMERVKGVILRNRVPPGLSMNPELMHRVCLALIDAMVELHAVDPRAVGLEDLGNPEGFMARQVAGWKKRYQNARTDDCPDFESIITWLESHIPESSSVSLIHNDFRYDNAVLDPQDLTRITAILDWEMATIGDPLSDVGVTLAYWAEPEDPEVLHQFGLSTYPGNLHRQQFLQRYAERSGRDVAGFLFYYVYGLFKNAIIALQIYARYRQGKTQDRRFGELIHVIRACGEVARRALEQQKISHLFG